MADEIDPHGTPGGGPVITKQEFAAESDMNLIVKRYMQTGALPYTPLIPPMYGDFSKGQHLHEIMETVRLANQEFMTLPAAVRFAANNNPAIFWEMMADEGGRAALAAAGLKMQSAAKAAPDTQPPGSPPAEPTP